MDDRDTAAARIIRRRRCCVVFCCCDVTFASCAVLCVLPSFPANTLEDIETVVRGLVSCVTSRLLPLSR